jgi:hypothetical protein
MPPHIYVHLRTTIIAQSVALNRSQQASSSSSKAAAATVRLTALPTSAYESGTQQVNIIHYSYISIVYIMCCNQRLSLQLYSS